MYFLLIILTCVLFNFGISSETVISRHNIHIGSKKLERNQASPEKLLEEKLLKEKGRQARSLQSILDYGETEPREFESKSDNYLYTNSIWKFIVQTKESKSGISSFEYKLNDSPILKYKDPVQLFKQGWNSIEFRAIDRLGNKEDWNVARIFQDVKPPSLEWKFEGEYFQIDEKFFITPQTKLHLIAVDKESGVKGIFFKENLSSWKSWDDAGYQPGAKNGNNKVIHLMVRALDQINNRSDIINIFLEMVEMVPPPIIDLTNFRVVGDKNYCSSKTKVRFSKVAPHILEKIYYKIGDSNVWRENVSGFLSPAENLEAGEWIIEYKTVNQLKQESEIKKWNCLIDKNSPRTEIFKKENLR